MQEIQKFEVYFFFLSKGNIAFLIQPEGNVSGSCGNSVGRC